MDIPILLAVEDDFALDPFNPTLVYNIKGGEGWDRVAYVATRAPDRSLKKGLLAWAKEFGGT